jgi:ABC-type nitrate/sulfonate/bicarbonate transport system permease component
VVASELTRVQGGDRVKRSLSFPASVPAKVWRVLSFLSFFVAWWAAANPWAPIASERVLPSPSVVAEAFWQHAYENVRSLDWSFSFLGYAVEWEFEISVLVHAVSITLGRVIISFVIAMVLGTMFGILMGRWNKVDFALDGWLMMGLNVPALIVGMLSFVWFGLNDTALIIAVVINKVPTVAVTVREGARAVERDLMQVARAFRLSWQKTLFKVYLPQLVPFILAAARSGLALLWKIILVYELLGRSSGVGFQLHTYFSMFDIKSVLAYAFSFMAVVILIELLLVRRIERRLTGWRLAN